MILTSALLASPALADGLSIPVTLIGPEGPGAAIGTISAQDSTAGLVLTPALTGLPPGPHGLHVHVSPSCAAGTKDGRAVAGLAAGPHYDPDATGAHRGPHDSGHRGDLPRLIVEANGSATAPLVAPRLSVADLHGRSIVIHAGGDTYSDQPVPLGGGAARIACGLVPAIP